MSAAGSSAPDRTTPSTPWETFPHGADVGVRGFGASMAEAFANAALALTSVITDPARVKPRERAEFACAAPDREVLLIDWLNRLVCAIATEDMLFSKFQVEIEHESLTAVAWGEPIDVARHAPAVEVKGATFTELAVVLDPGGRWRAQCVVDV